MVSDPLTGDVYAMASAPTFDPNRFGEFPSSSWSNRAVTDTWEPGSANKVITAAAALETGAVSPTEEFSVPATREIDGFVIHDSHPHAVETMTLGDIIAESSNIGSSLVADRVGSDALAAAFDRFGFGAPTGVGFPGEASGLIPPPGTWSDLTRATALQLGLSKWEKFGSIGLHSLAVLRGDASGIKEWIAGIPPSSQPAIFMDIGDNDQELEMAQQVESLFNDAGLNYEWHLYSGTHTEEYWSAHVQEYLLWYAEQWNQPQ